MNESVPTSAPPVRVEPDWEPIEPLRIEGGRGSFVSGDATSSILRVRYFRRRRDNRLVARAWFGPGAAGPPGHAHGGAISAVLDEAMGAAGWMAGYPVVAAHLEVDFKVMVPLGTDALIEAWVESVSGRKVYLASSLEDEEHNVLAGATALFVMIDPDRFGELLRRVAAAGGDAEIRVREMLAGLWSEGS